MDIDLTLGEPGLVLGDISPRFYVGTARQGGSFALSAISPGSIDYVLSGIPAPDVGQATTLTWEFPSGTGFARRWFGPHTFFPQAVIIPARESGLSPEDFELVLTMNGATVGAVLVVEELGSPGDYAVTGWPRPIAGERWRLRWGRFGIYDHCEWFAPNFADGTRLDLPDRLLTAFAVAWRAQAPPAPLAIMPHVVANGGGWRPANQEPFVQLDVLLDRGEEWGPVGMKNYDLPGLLQISVQVKSGDGTGLATQLVRIASQCIQGIVVQGFKCYGARMPYELPAPLSGYFGRAFDVPCRYVGP